MVLVFSHGGASNLLHVPGGWTGDGYNKENPFPSLLVHYLGTVASFAPSNSHFQAVELGWSYLQLFPSPAAGFWQISLLFSLTVNQ